MTVPRSASRYTLRRHEATPHVETANRRGIPILNCGIGNPLAFRDLHPFPPFIEDIERTAKDPKAFGYTDSAGLPKLREHIRDLFVPHNDVEVFLGAGISGLGDALFRTVFSRGDSIAIPQFSYILYLFHSSLNELSVQSVTLNPSGSIDPQSVERNIDERTRMVVVVTPGNPVGTCVPEEDFADIVRIVNEKEREFSHPIFLVADVIYEPFRRVGEPLDPIALARKHGRIGPTIHMDSLSKVKIVAPGARLGWMAIDWPKDNFPTERKEFFAAFERLLLPSLGTVDSLLQHALLATLKRITDDTRAHAAYRDFEQHHVTEVHARIDAMLDSLIERGVSFPDCYYSTPGDPASGVNTMGVTSSLYLNFGLISDQNTPTSPFAARLAEHGLEHGLVIASTPLASFVPSDQTAGLEHFARITALCDSEERTIFFQALDRFLADNPGARP